MRVSLTLHERNQIVVGRPLPFSVFSADGNLLLAAGRVVESEYARRILLNNGAQRGAADSGNSARPVGGPGERSDIQDESQPPARPLIHPLVPFQKSYRRASVARGLPMSMARDETSEAFRTHVIGAHDRILVVDAPVRSDGALVVVIPSQTWLCRTFQATSAFRFRGTVLRVAFEPFPHVYVDVPQAVETRKIRNRTRATVVVRATLELPTATPCIVVDLSAGGGRIATASDVSLELGQTIRITLKLELIGSEFELSLQAAIVRVFGATERGHPNVLFYGIRFESLTERDSLILHGFVNSQLSLELNYLWQLLSRPSDSDPAG